jgi:hypothetical protein
LATGGHAVVLKLFDGCVFNGLCVEGLRLSPGGGRARATCDCSNAGRGTRYAMNFDP